jgi:succinate dehydrogenase/fumarate reductase flavoprotein subunit
MKGRNVIMKEKEDSKRENPLMEESALSRRAFLKGVTLAGMAGAMSTAFGGCSPAGETVSATYLPESWNHEADIIVVGYGAAGAAAAITASMEGLGSCIVLEAAPEGEEGGNSRVCGQNMLIPQDVQSAVEYQKSLSGMYVISEDPDEEDALYRAWATEICKNKEWLEGLGAIVTETTMNSHEFPEQPGNEKGATCYLIDNTVGNSALWNVLKAQEDYLEFDVRYGTRAVKLVRDPIKNEVLGVEADQDGTTVYFKANKGVLLSCGGFHANMQMMRDYAPVGTIWDAFYGTPYNRGDGFKMVAPLGAALWHMNNTTGPSWGFSVCGEDSPHAWSGSFASKDFIYVGPNGKRFNNEEIYSTSRHGKFNINGVYQSSPFNIPSYTIFGQRAFEAGDILKPFSMGWASIVKGFIAEGNQGFLEAGVIKKADTIEELAEIIGYDPETLAETVAQYNGYCAAGADPDFHRGEPIYETMAVISAQGETGDSKKEAEKAASAGFELIPIEGPFYAMRMRPSMGANTQGGPRRGVGGEIMDVDNSAIPRLYAAGEFGPVYSYQYNGGGNVSEAMSSGRIAVRSIASLESWDQ